MGKSVDPQRLVAEVKAALRDMLFVSGLGMSPRRVDQLAQEMVASFVSFVERENPAAVNQYGQQLAREGLGRLPLLHITEILQRTAYESAESNLLSASGHYVRGLLDSYIGEREALVLQEQELIHQAFVRAASQKS